MTYDEQLKTENWKYLRNKVIDRDLGICQKCMSSKLLNVHHTKYVEGKMAWEYPMSMLTTLCEKCHEEFHANNKVRVVGSIECIPELFQAIYRDVASLRELDRRIALKEKKDGK